MDDKEKSVDNGSIYDYGIYPLRNDPELMKGLHDYIEEQKKIPVTGYAPGQFTIDFCDLDDEESLATMRELIDDPVKLEQILKKVPYKK